MFFYAFFSHDVCVLVSVYSFISTKSDKGQATEKMGDLHSNLSSYPFKTIKS